MNTCQNYILSNGAIVVADDTQFYYNGLSLEFIEDMEGQYYFIQDGETITVVGYLMLLAGHWVKVYAADQDSNDEIMRDMDAMDDGLELYVASAHYDQERQIAYFIGDDGRFFLVFENGSSNVFATLDELITFHNNL